MAVTTPIARTPATDPADAPLETFSQCHAGILSNLQRFGELPALLEPAAKARQIATDMLTFFRDAVFEHHAQEERELFPAVLASTSAGDERQSVQRIVDRLTEEHRQVEVLWSQLEPALKQVAHGHDAHLDPTSVASLVAAYRAHATYEEQVFLPMSQNILGRDSNHMAALGVSLHIRHAMPGVLAKYGSRS
jgi:hemerythrin superfamily protein